MTMKYKLDIDLNVLNHLGLSLYSNVPAVLSELIANAWDADAEKVAIDVAGDKKSITIQDDGCGMSSDDLNKKFLTVGYKRREESGSETAKKKRPVMGRKGIGKLSVFSIAKKIQVITKTDDSKEAGIALNVKDIQKAVEKRKPYYPKELKLKETSKKITTDSGTIIILSDLKKRISKSLTKNLKKRVARRFDIISNDFVVKVNKRRVESKDKGYMNKIEYVFTYGNYDKHQLGNIDDQHIKKRNNNIKSGNSSYKVTGWIGAAKEHKDLQNGDGNLNKISIFCRGKMALEDILASYGESRIARRYITGEISADFLDATNREDITTSSRQDFVQDDERFVALKKFIEEELKAFITKWVRLKAQEGTKKATEIPQVKKWFETLKGDSKKAAKSLFGKINQIATEESYKTLLKHGVLAFSYMAHHDKLNQLSDVSVDNLQEVITAFSSLDDIEAAWYYEITKDRLEKIKKLAEIADDENQLEKVIQEYIYNHLWLLDPSWDRATEQPFLEKGVTHAFEKISSKLDEEEKKGRIDIRYKKTTGKHIIIELKRTGSWPTFGELIDQVDKYKWALSKQLEANNDDGPIEVICLVGLKRLRGWQNKDRRQEDEKTLAQKNIRVITYNQLISDAEKSYQEYLDKNKDKLGQLKEVMDALEVV